MAFFISPETLLVLANAHRPQLVTPTDHVQALQPAGLGRVIKAA